MQNKLELQTLETFEKSNGSRWLNWSSFIFAFLQSVCLALISVSGIRLAIGLSSLFVAGGVYPALLRFHADHIRIPMMLFALFGSLLNLFVVWQVRRLRARPASAWRQGHARPVSLKAERTQIVLSGATLVLLLVEVVLHQIIPH